MKRHINVKPFQETLFSNMCGPACLKIVLDFYGIEKSESELADICNIDKDIGTNDENLKNAAESFGFRVEIKNNSTFEDIENLLDKKVPIILDWFTRGRSDYTNSSVADGHYSVVEGLDDTYIFLQDPEIGEIRKIKRDDFLGVWFDFKGKYINPNELIIRQIIAIYKI